MKYKNTHSYTILNYLYKFAVLLIFPILQQIIFKPQTLKDIIMTFWKNILLIIFILIWAFIKYRSIKYSLYENKIFIKKGIFIKEKVVIPVEKINSIDIMYNFFAAFFGAYKIIINVPSDKKKKQIVSLNFSYEDLEELKTFVFNKEETNIFYKADRKRIILLSLFWSNPLTSFILAVPFIYRFSKILGEELSNKIYSTVDIRVNLIAWGLPPLFASIAYILMATFLVAFFIQFFRYSNFEARGSPQNIFIGRGVINKNNKIIKKEKISTVSIKQTLLMHFLKLYSVYIMTESESDASEAEILTLVAANYSEVVKGILKNIPIKPFNKTGVKPKKTLLKNFLFLPITCFILIIICIYKLEEKIWYSKAIALFLRLIILFLLWWILFRIKAHRNSGIALDDGILNICGFKRMTLFSEYIPISRISKIDVSQNISQRFSNRCNLKIYVSSDLKKSFCCKHLPLKDVENFVESVKNYKNILIKE